MVLNVQLDFKIQKLMSLGNLVDESIGMNTRNGGNMVPWIFQKSSKVLTNLTCRSWRTMSPIG